MMHDQVMESLKWRYAVKKFDSEKRIDPKDFEAIEEALRMSPSSHGLQPWKFVVVQSPEVRAKLHAASWNQPQVIEASHYVVLAYQDHVSVEHVDRYMNFIAATQGVGVDTLERFRKSIIGDIVEGARSKMIEHWAIHQVYIAMGFAMQAAAIMKVDSCPMEGLNPVAYDEILGLKGTGYRTAAAIAFGYRHPECRRLHLKKVRFPKEEVFKYV